MFLKRFTTSTLMTLKGSTVPRAMVPRSITSAKPCVNHLFGYTNGYGKSPCFSRYALSSVVNVDVGGPCLPVLNVGVLP
jgi:hypothetical protein